MAKKKITFNAPVTLWFALISLASLGLGYLTNFSSTQNFFMTYHSSLASPLTYLRFFSHVLGHANWNHYISNMSYILLLGPLVEEKYGSDKLLAMILVTAGISGVLNYIFFPTTGLCGASGICFMLIVISSITSVKSGEIPLTLILVLVIYLGQEVYNALFVVDSISQFAHIIGGLIGGAFGFAFLPKRRY